MGGQIPSPYVRSEVSKMILIIVLLSILNFGGSNQPAGATGHLAQPSVIQSESGTGV